MYKLRARCAERVECDPRGHRRRCVLALALDERRNHTHGFFRLLFTRYF